MIKIKLLHLYQSEITSGILLMISFASAVFLSNIDFFQNLYTHIVFYPILLDFGPFFYKGPLIQVVNDGLMTLFFLLIGLELKFHLVRGEFKDKKTLILPGASAFGGIFFPALIYIFLNFNTQETLKGWAIPIATDTAFMLGVLSFFGKLVQSKLRAFIIGFSLIDDAIALLILALFYTKSLELTALKIMFFLIILLFLMNRLKIMKSGYYLFLGVFLWIIMLESGIHGTLSGIVLALAIPVEKDEVLNPSFNRLENFLKPLVYFFVLPLFAFINSGVSFQSLSFSDLLSPLSLGIILGLFIGKPLGIALCAYLVVKFNYCTLPQNVSWGKFLAIAMLGGIGFTLSLLIGDLTFEHSIPNYIMRMSVVTGSFLSALAGISLLIFLKKRSTI